MMYLNVFVGFLKKIHAIKVKHVCLDMLTFLLKYNIVILIEIVVWVNNVNILTNF